jgi:hypothetical protein
MAVPLGRVRCTRKCICALCCTRRRSVGSSSRACIFACVAASPPKTSTSGSMETESYREEAGYSSARAALQRTTISSLHWMKAPSRSQLGRIPSKFSRRLWAGSRRFDYSRHTFKSLQTTLPRFGNRRTACISIGAQIRTAIALTYESRLRASRRIFCASCWASRPCRGARLRFARHRDFGVRRERESNQ